MRESSRISRALLWLRDSGIYSPRSLSFRLALASVSMVLALSVIGSWYFLAQQERNLSESYQNELQTLADAAAQSVSIGLANDDLTAMMSISEWLKSRSEIEYILFVDTEGELIASFPEKYNAVSKLLDVNAGQNHSVISSGADIYDGGELFGRIILARSLGGLRQMIADERRNAAWAAVFAMLLGVALSIWGGTAIVAPLRRLSQATAGVARGSYKRVEESSSIEEVSDLARRFNLMVDEIASQTSILIDSNEQLLTEMAERALAEKERVKLEEQLRQAQKMEAVGTLAGGIAHDFNNLLGAILGYNELAQSLTDEDSDVRKHLGQIHVAGTRAKTLVLQILNFSRKTDKENTPVSVEVIVEEALSDIRIADSSNINLQKHIEENVGCVMSDPTEVHRVVMNLCRNAIQAMEQTGGTLSIDLDTVRVSSDFADQHLIFEDRNYIRLTVRDNGCGIDEKHLKRIFEPFFTTKDVGKGTGLGLSTVHSSLRIMRGAVSVHSVKGEGTTFFVYFPQTDTAGERCQESSEIPRGSGQRVMVVDDEELLATMCSTMLRQLDYAVTSFTVSVDALKTFTSSPDAFDIILTDQRMPNMTGVELSSEIHKVRPTIPIVLVSGHSEEVNRESAASLGFSDYLSKPYSKKDLGESLSKILENADVSDSPVV